MINANFTFISMCRLFFEMENGYNAHNEAIINFERSITVSVKEHEPPKKPLIYYCTVALVVLLLLPGAWRLRVTGVRVIFLDWSCGV